MKVIAGLGNMGTQYTKTRHNIGFQVIEILKERHHMTSNTRQYHAECVDGVISGMVVKLLKPQTWMNLSGKSIVAFFKDHPEIPLGDLIVVHDEIDLDFGMIRVKSHGGHGGHKGVRSIMEMTGRDDFVRIRAGIGRPAHGSVTDFVLEPFDPEESIVLPTYLSVLADVVEDLLVSSINDVMNRYHGKNFVG